MLEIKKLAKSEDGVPLFTDVTFSLAQYRSIAIVGTNKKGLDAVCDIICGKVSPEEGRVIYRCKDITETPSYYRLKKGIARFEKKPMLFGEMTVYENIYNQNRICAADRSLIDYSMQLLSLKQVAAKYPCALDEYTAKKVSLACAIASGCKLLICQGIQCKSVWETEEIINCIKKAKRELLLSLLVIADDMDYIQAICDKVYLIHSGKVICTGTPKAIFSSNECRSILQGRGIPASVDFRV